jgi:hypothetical protein
MTPAQARRRVLALYAFAEYLSGQVAACQPGRGDLLAGLVLHSEGPTGMTQPELVATAVLFLAALYGSTIDMVGNLVASMARNPEQYQRVRAAPGLAAAAVEEVFRYEAPFQIVYRRATTELRVDGYSVPAGSRVALLLGAANRDPAEFDRPDVFDVCRADNRHVAFGSGLHNCLGVPFSRAWAQAALLELVARVSRLVPAGPFTARSSRAFRGYRNVPVTW